MRENKEWNNAAVVAYELDETVAEGRPDDADAGKTSYWERTESKFERE